MLVTAAVGVVYLVLAPLLWTHAQDGLHRLLVLPPALIAAIDRSSVQTAVTVTAAYTLLLGLAMLALVPLAVLAWRRWPPARPIFWAVGGLLLAGQLVEVLASVFARHAAASATHHLAGLPASVGGNLAPTFVPTWSLPTTAALAAASAALLLATALLLRQQRPGRPA
jgi:hypothetical protein